MGNLDNVSSSQSPPIVSGLADFLIIDNNVVAGMSAHETDNLYKNLPAYGHNGNRTHHKCIASALRRPLVHACPYRVGGTRTHEDALLPTQVA